MDHIIYFKQIVQARYNSINRIQIRHRKLDRNAGDDASCISFFFLSITEPYCPAYIVYINPIS